MDTEYIPIRNNTFCIAMPGIAMLDDTVRLTPWPLGAMHSVTNDIFPFLGRTPGDGCVVQGSQGSPDRPTPIRRTAVLSIWVFFPT